MSSDDNMQDADVANGENPDEATRQPEPRPTVGAPPNRDGDDESERTGEKQAEQNREVDPPA